MKEYEFLRTDLHNGVFTLTLNRPKSLNALNPILIDEIIHAVEENTWREDVKVLLLRAEGRAFCAGFDITTEREGSTRAQWLSSKHFGKAVASVREAPVITVSLIHGHAVGAGLCLATATHLRYAAENSIFSIPEIALGIPFSLGSTAALVRDIGPVAAADMIINGEQKSASWARDVGLITEVGPYEAMQRRSKEVANRIAAYPSVVALQTIGTLREAAHMSVGEPADDIAAILLARGDSESNEASSKYRASVLKNQ